MTSVEARFVEVVVFRRPARSLEYLVLRRSDADRRYPGIWQIVSGTIHEGEAAIGAAARELREETGLLSGRLWTLPFVNSLFDPAGDVVHMVPTFAAEVGSEDVVRLSAEHQEYQWLDPARARSALLWPGSHRALDITEQYLLKNGEIDRWLRWPGHERKELQ